MPTPSTPGLLGEPGLHEALIEAALNGVAVADLEGRITYVNPAFLRLWGHPSPHDVLGRSVATFWDDPASVAQVLRSLDATGAWYGELVARRADGALRTFEVSARRLHRPDGEAYAQVATFVDVTEARAAEADRRRNEERYRRAECASNDGLWDWNVTTGEHYVSPRWYDVLGYAPGALGTDLAAFADLLHPDDRARVQEVVDAHLAEGALFDVEQRMRRGDGTYVWVRARGLITTDERGHVRMTIAISDISLQKRTEEQLREAHRLAGVGAWELELATHRLWWSPEQYAINGLPDGAAITQDTFTALVHPDDRARIQRAFEHVGDVGSVGVEYRIVRPDGGVRHLHGTASVVRDAQGRAVRLAGTNLDVTARVAIEEALRCSLAEKETLLREIHHRVKNNLQIVSSLLHFQAKRLSAPQDVDALVELRQRLLAMSLLHERLYKSSDLARIDFAAYVHALVAELFRAAEGARGVRLAIEAEPVCLPMEVAMPAGMIVCELVTNVLKYAFPDGASGAATVRIARRDGAIALAVRDDGVGLPGGFDPRTHGSFGWNLVRALVQQIEGELSVGDGPGTSVEVVFPASPPPASA